MLPKRPSVASLVPMTTHSRSTARSSRGSHALGANIHSSRVDRSHFQRDPRSVSAPRSSLQFASKYRCLFQRPSERERHSSRRNQFAIIPGGVKVVARRGSVNHGQIQGAPSASKGHAKMIDPRQRWQASETKEQVHPSVARRSCNDRNSHVYTCVDEQSQRTETNRETGGNSK